MYIAGSALLKLNSRLSETRIWGQYSREWTGTGISAHSWHQSILCFYPGSLVSGLWVMNHDVYNSPFKNFVLFTAVNMKKSVSVKSPSLQRRSVRQSRSFASREYHSCGRFHFLQQRKEHMFWIFSLVLKILIQNINRWHPEVGKTAAPNLRNIRPQVAKLLSWFTPINLSTLINLDQPEHLAQPEHLDHLDQPEHLDHLYHLDQPEHTQIEHVNRNFTPSKG